VVSQRAVHVGSVLTPKQKAFLEWLCTPRELRDPPQQKAWAAANQVDPMVVTAWKKDIKFREHWDRRLTELQIDPERIDLVMEALYQRAVAGSEKAIQMYLQVVREFRPSRASIEDSEGDVVLASLSDDELAAMIAEAADQERERRSALAGD